MTLPPPRLRGVEMPTLYTINNLLVDTVVNITNIINKYDSTILIYFLCFFFIYTRPHKLVALILIVFK